MKAFQIEETSGKETAWIYPELDGDFDPVHGEPDPAKFAVELKYVTPRGREAYRRKLLNQGILKRKVIRGNEVFDDVPGMEEERDLLFAQTFIAGFSGLLGQDKQPVPYSPQMMATLLSSKVWLNKAVSKALEELDSFFGQNGNGSSAA